MARNGRRKIQKITPEKGLEQNTEKLFHLTKEEKEKVKEEQEIISEIKELIALQLKDIEFEEENTEVNTKKVIDRLKAKNFIKRINEDNLLDGLIKLYDITKGNSDIIFLNYLKENFSKLKEEEKLDIINFLYNDKHIDKSILYLFFKDIDLRKIKKNNRQIQWSKLFDKVDYNYYKLDIEEGTNLFNIIEEIKKYNGTKKRPHQDKNFINKTIQLFNKETLEEFLTKSKNNNFSYNTNRLFIELAHKKGLFENMLNSDFWNISDFGMKQKILEKALISNIDLIHYPKIQKFLNSIINKKNKSEFQEELINLYNQNSKLIPTIQRYLLKIKSKFSKLFKK